MNFSEERGAMEMAQRTPLQQYWGALADRLALEVDLDYRVPMADEELVIPVRLRHFGAEQGMLLVTEWGAIEAHAEALVERGYGYSCLSEPDSADAAADIDYALEMLTDWGWCGPGPHPAWLPAK